jgi:hypothetical protein
MLICQYLQKLLEPYTRNPADYTLTLGPDPIHYYALTTDPIAGQGNPITVYVWGRSTTLECAVGSCKGEFVAKAWSNRMFLIPYPQIQNYFQETLVKMEEGGM